MRTFKMPVPGQRVDNKALHEAYMRRLRIDGYIMNVVGVVGVLSALGSMWLTITRVCH